MTVRGETGAEACRSVLRRIETVLVGCLVVLALGIFLLGSALRVFAPAYAIDWAEEVTIYLIVWAALLTGGSLAASGEHISAQIAVNLLPPRARRYLTAGIELLTLAFCALMAWLGVEAVLFAQMLDERSASTLQAPQAWVLYLALPVSMSLIVLSIGFALLRRD